MVINLVILSSCDLRNGGRETWLRNFIECVKVDSSVSKVVIYCIDEPNAIISHICHPKVKLEKIKLESKKGFFRALEFTYKILSKTDLVEKKDEIIVGFGGVIEAFTIYLLNQKKHKKLFVWLRTVSFEEMKQGSILRKRIIQKIEKHIYSKKNILLLSNGDDIKNIYESLINKTVTSIKNGIDPACFSIGESRVSNKKNRIKILYVGRLVEVKGFLYVVSLIEQLRYMELEFIIVGEGPLKHLIPPFSNVTYVGHQSNDKVLEYYSDADITLNLTYKGGGISNSLIESMACGNLIVCWDNPIFRQVVDDNSAVMVENISSKDLISKIMYLADNWNTEKNEFDTKINNSRMISNNYSLDKNYKRFKNVVQTLKVQ